MNIVVTGASRGIGYEIVKYLSRDNNNTLIALARSHDQLKQLEKDCRDEHGAAITICTQDLCDRAYKQLNTAIEQVDQIDIIINNAGYLINKPFKDINQEEWFKLLDINVLSTVDLVKTLLPKLEKSPQAHIVNIGSMGGFQGSSKFPGLSAYSVAKGALAILSECLAVELSDKNIRCNCLCLGAVNTDMLAEAFPGYKAPVEPHEMAEYISEFALKAHQYMNGQIIPVTLSNP